MKVRLSSFLNSASLHLNGENAESLRNNVVFKQVLNHSRPVEGLDGVTLDCSLSSFFEKQAFDILMSREPISPTYSLTIPKDADLRAIPALLKRGMPILALHLKPRIRFANDIPTATTEQAHEIFNAIQNSHVRHNITFPVSDNEGFMSAMACHIQASTNLEELLFLSQTIVSPEAIGIIFDAIAESTSLKTIGFYGHFVSEANLDVATGNLAKSVAKSESITSFRTFPFAMEDTCHVLAHTDAVKNFDLSFVGQDLLSLTRPSRWKRLLPLETIPLGLWPHILQEAANVKRPAVPRITHTKGGGYFLRKQKYRSHTNPKDVVYFLLRERNGILTKDANGPRHTCALCATTLPRHAATDKLNNHSTQCDMQYSSCRSETYCAKCKEYHRRRRAILFWTLLASSAVLLALIAARSKGWP